MDISPTRNLEIKFFPNPLEKPHRSCHFHQYRPAVYFCQKCQLPICKECKRISNEIRYGKSSNFVIKYLLCPLCYPKYDQAISHRHTQEKEFLNHVKEQNIRFRTAALDAGLDIGALEKKMSLLSGEMQSIEEQMLEIYNSYEEIRNSQKESFHVYCVNCGHEIMKYMQFCPNCGISTPKTPNK